MSSIILYYIIKGPSSNTYTALLNFKQFGELHPYMKSVEIISQSENTIEYLVHEKLKLWGFIPMAPSYKATITEVEKNKHIRYWSEVQKGLFLTIDFTFKTDAKNTSTEVSEQITLKGTPWVHAVFLSLLKKSHRQVFENLQK
ncbi:MAG: hypothetical protein H7282_13220 [Cytophagaceae bacterium]|nr:hypothetical protein [Cytophagaceae bacterium]